MNVVLVVIGFIIFFCFSSCSNQPDMRNIEGNDFSSAANNREQSNITGMLHPCKWSFKVEQITPGEAILISTARIDSGWHLYSQHISDKGSPTIFNYSASADYKLIGGTEEGATYKEEDPYLQIEILYFKTEAVFRQKIEVLTKEDFVVTGTINNTACLTQCVTSEEDFSFKVNGNPSRQ